MRGIIIVFLLSLSFVPASASANWLSSLWGKITNVSSKSIPRTKHKRVPNGASTTRIAVTSMVASVLLDAGLNELEAYPVTPEIIEEIDKGHSTYQTRVCVDDAGDVHPVPKNFSRCPFGKETIHYGPILNLNRG